MKAKYLIILAVVCIALGALLDRVAFNIQPPVVQSDTIYIPISASYQAGPLTPAPIKVEFKGTVDVTKFETIPADVDTAAILADYFAVRSYDDVLIDNDTLTFRLKEETYANRIRNRYFDADIHFSEKIVTNTVYRTGFYGYGAIGSDLRGFYPSAGIMYQNNKGLLYGAGIGLYQKPYLYFNIAIPIR